MIFELPCQMLTKFVLTFQELERELMVLCGRWLGPGKTLPLFGFLFGLFTFAMAFVKSFGAGIAVRFCKLPRRCSIRKGKTRETDM